MIDWFFVSHVWCVAELTQCNGIVLCVCDGSFCLFVLFGWFVLVALFTIMFCDFSVLLLIVLGGTGQNINRGARCQDDGGGLGRKRARKACYCSWLPFRNLVSSRRFDFASVRYKWLRVA